MRYCDKLLSQLITHLNIRNSTTVCGLNYVYRTSRIEDRD